MMAVDESNMKIGGWRETTGLGGVPLWLNADTISEIWLEGEIVDLDVPGPFKVPVSLLRRIVERADEEKEKRREEVFSVVQKMDDEAWNKHFDTGNVEIRLLLNTMADNLEPQQLRALRAAAELGGGSIWFGSAFPRYGLLFCFAGEVRGPNSLYTVTPLGRAVLRVREGKKS